MPADLTVVELLKKMTFGLGELNIAEVGAYRCETSVEILTELGERCNSYTVIDPWELYEGYDQTTPGEDETIRYIANNGDGCYEHAINSLKAFPHASVIREKSIDGSFKFKDHSLSGIIIDGNHSYEFVSKDIHAWSKKIVENGWMIFDGYHWPGVKKAVDEAFDKNCLIFEGKSKMRKPDGRWGDKLSPKTAGVYLTFLN